MGRSRIRSSSPTRTYSYDPDLKTLYPIFENREPSDKKRKEIDKLNWDLAQIQVQDKSDGGRIYKYRPGEGGSGLVPSDGGQPQARRETPMKSADDSDWNKELEQLRIHLRACVQPPGPMDKKFDQIIGYDKAKATLRSLLLSLRQPQAIDPNRVKSAVMMFGPPGTGKTTLAKALANESGISFMNVGIEDVKTKWKGDSEKLIAQMFVVAQEVRPCVLFIDEIDGLIQESGDEDNRSVGQKSVLKRLMDDLGPGKKYHSIYVVTNTNFPWNLPTAFRSRTAKRMFIDLPTDATRKAMFLQDKYYRAADRAKPGLIDDFVRITKMHSGRDIENIMSASYDEKIDEVSIAQWFVYKWSEIDSQKKYFPCGPNTRGAIKMHSGQVPRGEIAPIQPTVNSMRAAFELVKPPLTVAERKMHQDWCKRDGFNGGDEVEIKDDWLENNDPDDRPIVLLPEDGGPGNRGRRNDGGGSYGARGRSGVPSNRRSTSYRPPSPLRPNYSRSKTDPSPPAYSSVYPSTPPSLVSSSGYSDSITSSRNSRPGSRQRYLPSSFDYYPESGRKKFNI